MALPRVLLLRVGGCRAGHGPAPGRLSAAGVPAVQGRDPRSGQVGGAVRQHAGEDAVRVLLTAMSVGRSVLPVEGNYRAEIP
jgi:hypothetical protein